MTDETDSVTEEVNILVSWKREDVTEEDIRKVLRIVWDVAERKVLNRRNKPGNTDMPWIDFSKEHLENRLEEEIEEWKKSKSTHELTDIINLAAFLKLRILFESTHKAFTPEQGR